LNQVFGHSSGPMIEKYSVITQIVMGDKTNWYTGLSFQKVGKLTEFAVGGDFFLL
jgi:FUN14 domain-containing protein 1